MNAKFRIKKSALIAYLFVTAVMLLCPLGGEAAVYMLGVPLETAMVGEEFEIKIGIDAQEDKINVVDVRAILPQGVEFVRFIKDQSAISLWVKEPEYDKEARTISFIGGVPGGFAGRVILLGVVVKSKLSGIYTVGVDPASQAYVNDGVGTQALLQFQDATVEIKGSQRLTSRWAWMALAIGLIGIIVWNIWYKKRKTVRI
ncbi:MAG: hypothetical protein Q7S48_04710 [bacterium]|nr:hypothetical protein [bacterium]